jgi:Fic family protein
MTGVDRFRALLDRTKQVTSPDALRQAVERATKWAAVDTGAIEGLYEVDRGFTFTVAMEAASWDNIHLAKGEGVERAIKDAHEAYDYVLDVVTGSSPISETWIKQLHSIICASQDEYTVVTPSGLQRQGLPKGAYKSQPNSPFNLASGSIHEYAPPSDTPAEMYRLVQELRSAQFQNAHPVIQAAYAHYAFVCIHPFADGNGRVARALASAFLYKSPGVPLVVFADQKAQYLDALEAADAGDSGPFVQFMADRVVDTIQMVRTEMSRRTGTPLSQRVAQMQESLTGRGGIRHDELDAIAGRLLENFHAVFSAAIEGAGLQAPLTASMRLGPGVYTGAPDGYRQPPPIRGASANVSSASPANGQDARSYHVLVAKPDEDGPDFLLVRAGAIEPLLEAAIREVHPTVSAALTYRLAAVAEDQLAEMVDFVVEQGIASLEEKGYR